MTRPGLFPRIPRIPDLKKANPRTEFRYYSYYFSPLARYSFNTFYELMSRRKGIGQANTQLFNDYLSIIKAQLAWLNNYLFMSMKNTLIPIVMLSLTFLASQSVAAAKVYQWTDEDGVVHFSDVRPGENVTNELREMDIYTDDDNNADPEMYSIINQADRMAERRRQITEERLAIKRLQLEERRMIRETENRRYDVIGVRQYLPFIYYRAYPQPSSFYFQRSRTYHHTGHLYQHRHAHQGRFSVGGHMQTNTHFSKIGIRF
jgi:hypothetical protein